MYKYPLLVLPLSLSSIYFIIIILLPPTFSSLYFRATVLHLLSKCHPRPHYLIYSPNPQLELVPSLYLIPSFVLVLHPCPTWQSLPPHHLNQFWLFAGHERAGSLSICRMRTLKPNITTAPVRRSGAVSIARRHTLGMAVIAVLNGTSLRSTQRLRSLPGRIFQQSARGPLSTLLNLPRLSPSSAVSSTLLVVMVTHLMAATSKSCMSSSLQLATSHFVLSSALSFGTFLTISTTMLIPGFRPLIQQSLIGSYASSTL